MWYLVAIGLGLPVVLVVVEFIRVGRKNRREKTEDTPMIKGFLTIMFGISFTVCLMRAFWITYWHFIDQNGPNVFWWKLASLLVELNIILYFFYSGLANIPYPNKGQLLLFGERLGRKRPFLIKEGYAWALPKPLMFIVAVNTERKVFSIDEAEVLAQNVPVKITTVLEYVVKEPYKYLSVGVSVVHEGLEAMVMAAVREYCAPKNCRQVGQDDKAITKRLGKIGDRISNDWGIDVLKIMVKRIKLPDNIEEAAAQKDKEEEERSAEKIEATHLADMIKTYTATGVSPAEAARMAQAERGKMVRTEQIFSGDVSAAVAGALGRLLGAGSTVTGKGKKKGKKGGGTTGP